jgi:hypothetical protein
MAKRSRICHTSALIEEVRLAFFAHLQTVTAYDTMYFQPEQPKPTSPKESLHNLGVSMTDAQRLAALKTRQTVPRAP